MFSNRIFSVIYKAILVTISFIAIYDTIFNANADTFAYFTTLSNVLVLVVFLYILIRNIIDLKNNDYKGYNTHLLRFKNTTTLVITVTFLVYAFLLADYSMKANYTIRNLSVHYIVPMMVIADYFLFDKHGELKWYHPLIWVGCALLYLPFIFIRAAIIGSNPDGLVKYPYFFLNVDKLGIPGVALWIVILLGVFMTLSNMLYLYDRKFKSRNID